MDIPQITDSHSIRLAAVLNSSVALGSDSLSAGGLIGFSVGISVPCSLTVDKREYDEVYIYIESF